MSRAAAVKEPFATPAWLTQGDVALCPCGCIGKRKRGSFVEKTIGGGANLMRQAMFSDDVANQRGFLQRLDPRVKMLTLFGLLLVAAFVRHIPVLLAMYALTLLLAAMTFAASCYHHNTGQRILLRQVPLASLASVGSWGPRSCRF